MDFLWGGSQKIVLREEAENRLVYFLRLLKYNLIQIMVVNLLFVFCCLPIVTILPAIGGLQYSFFCLVNEDAELVQNFFEGMKLVLKRQWKAVLMQTVVFAAILFALVYYYYFGFIGEMAVFRIAVCAMGLGMMYFLMMSVYYYQVLLQEKATIRNAWKKSFFLASISFLPCFLFLAVIFAGFYLTAILPAFVFFLISFFFGVNGLISVFLYDYYNELWTRWRAL